MITSSKINSLILFIVSVCCLLLVISCNNKSKNTSSQSKNIFSVKPKTRIILEPNIPMLLTQLSLKSSGYPEELSDAINEAKETALFKKTTFFDEFDRIIKKRDLQLKDYYRDYTESTANKDILDNATADDLANKLDQTNVEIVDLMLMAWARAEDELSVTSIKLEDFVKIREKWGQELSELLDEQERVIN